jgi:hypothetical protein
MRQATGAALSQPALRTRTRFGSSFRDVPSELGFTRVQQYHCPSRQRPTWMAQTRNPAAAYGFWIPGSREERAPRNDGCPFAKSFRDASPWAQTRNPAAAYGSGFRVRAKSAPRNDDRRLVIRKSFRPQLHAPMHLPPGTLELSRPFLLRRYLKNPAHSQRYLPSTVFVSNSQYRSS